MNFDLNQSMVALAKDKADELARQLQVNAVIVIIAHSDSQIAVGHAHDTNESVESVRDILQDAADNFTKNPP